MESVLGKHIEDWLNLISSSKKDRRVSTIAQTQITAELLVPKTLKKSKKVINKQDLLKIFSKGKKVHSSSIMLHIYRTKLNMKKVENISILTTEFNISELSWDKDSIETQILFSIQEPLHKSQNSVKLPFDFSLRFENTEKKKNFLMKLHLSKDEHNKIIKSRDNDIKHILSQPLPSQKNDTENFDVYLNNEETNIGKIFIFIFILFILFYCFYFFILFYFHFLFHFLFYFLFFILFYILLFYYL